MPAMAAKKKKVHTKGLPKPKYEIQAVSLNDLFEDTESLHEQACKTKMDCYMVMLHQADEAREYVNMLAHNYERVCYALAEAQRLLKEPSIVHAIDMAKRVKELEQKVFEIDELRRDLDRHESNYNHERTDPYY